MHFGDHPYRYSGYAGLLVFVAIFVFSILNSFLGNFLPLNLFIGLLYPIEGIVLGALAAVLFYGYAILGKKINYRFMTALSWTSIALIFLTLIFVYLLLISNDLISLSASNTVTFDEFFIELSSSLQDQTYFNSVGKTLLSIHFFIAIIWGVQSILFGSSLLKLQDRIPMARITGSLNIIAGATLIFIIGYIIIFIAYLYNAILMIKIGKANTELHEQAKKTPRKKSVKNI